MIAPIAPEERPAPTPEFIDACARAFKRGARTNKQLSRVLRRPLVEIEDAFVELVRRKVVPSTLAIALALASLVGCEVKVHEDASKATTPEVATFTLQRQCDKQNMVICYRFAGDNAPSCVRTAPQEPVCDP